MNSERLLRRATVRVAFLLSLACVGLLNHCHARMQTSADVARKK